MLDDVLTMRISSTKKRALRIIAAEKGYKNVSEFVSAVIEEHTDVNARAILLAKSVTDMKQNVSDGEQHIEASNAA
jgi:hypothetical protein